jgi:superfamily II DNA or RNA helicase
MRKKVFVTLTNRKVLLHRPYPFDGLNDILRYRKIGWEYTPAAKYNGWDGYIHLLHHDTIGTGVFLSLKEKMETEANVQFVVKDGRKSPEFDWKRYGEVAEKADAEKKIRPYQQDCLEKMVAASGTGGLVLNSTGTGKTRIAGMYFRALKGPGVFFVDELTLLDQAKKEIEEVLGEPVGEIGNSIFAPKRITVATIQTVHRHRLDPRYVPWNRTLQTIFIDEIHLALNRRNFQTVAVIQPPTIFGLTATLELRKKYVSMRAYDLAGPIVFEYPLQRGVDEGYLSKGVAVAVQVENEIESVKFNGKGNWFQRRKFYRERYPIEYQRLIVEGKKRNLVIEQLVREAHKKGKYTIVLVDRVQHLKDLGNALDDVRHKLVFGERKVEDRVDSKERFETGDLRLLIVNKVFKKGVNIKRVDVLIDGAGMKSKNDAVQKYGRGVRMADGKKGLIYFDVADVGNRFEKAAKSRRAALKKVGVPVYKVDSSVGAKRILELAEKKLAASL